MDGSEQSYPSYQGSERSFTQALCYIEWLDAKDNHSLDPASWDEFIRVLATDYLDYARDNVLANGMDKKKALTGIAFFDKKRKEPPYRSLFTKGIITSSTIERAILSLDSNEVRKARDLLITSGAKGNGHGGSSLTPTPTISAHSQEHPLKGTTAKHYC